MHDYVNSVIDWESASDVPHGRPIFMNPSDISINTALVQTANKTQFLLHHPKHSARLLDST